MNDVLVVLLFILVSAFYAGAETGAYCLNRLRLRLRESWGERPAVQLARLTRDRQAFVATTLGATNLTRYGASAFATAFFSRVGLPHPEVWATAAVTPLALVLGEILPKAFFATYANTLMYRLTWPLRATRIVTWPLTLVLKGVMRFFSVLFGAEEADVMAQLTTGRIRYFLAEGRLGGTLTDDQGRIANNIMALKQKPVRAVMTPMASVVAVPRDIGPEALRRAAETMQHSRVPVYDGVRDNIGGILVLLEFIASDRPDARPADFVRPAVHVPAMQPIDEALRRLRRRRQHMGVVVDAKERPIGIVTLKDLIEEIVGELKEW